MPASDRTIWGPVVEGRARRRRRVLIVVSTLLATLLVVTVVGVLWANAQVPRMPVEDLAASGRPLHVLLVGSDRRDLLTAEEQRELSVGRAEGERTDTIMVLTIDRGQIATLAFPRDLWVRRCDGTEGRINAATAIGGPECLVNAIRDHSGIHVHHYIEITFGGFRDLVDAVGGVELCLDDPIRDRDAGIDLPAGCQRLDGVDALGYVRVRKIDDDIQRIGRQKEFLEALAREIAAPSLLLNPVRAIPVARQVSGALSADDTLGITGLWQLGRGLMALATGSADNYVVPTRPRVTSAGAAVLDTIVAEAEPLFEAFRSGAILGERGESNDDAALMPNDIHVTIYNAAGVAGLASQTAQQLAEEGFVIAAVGNADRQSVTRILHPPDDAEAANLVADSLRIQPEFDATTAVTTVTVILGEDRRG